MPVFEYRAKRADGEPISGTVTSQDLASAVQNLAQQGLVVEHVGMAPAVAAPSAAPSATHSIAMVTPGQSSALAETPGQERAAVAPVGPAQQDQRSYFETSILGPLVGKVPLHHLLFFFRQFATMHKAGVPIVQTMDTLSNQTHDAKLRTIVREMRDVVLEGRPVSEVIARYPEVFPPLHHALVRTGERAGMLDQTLDHLANYIAKEIELRNLIKRLTMYPKIVLAASIVIILGANLIISYIGGKGFIDSPLTNPLTWVFLTPLIIMLFLFTRIGLANPRGKYEWDRFLLSIPAIGNVVHQFAMSKFGRAFGAMYAGGVPIPEAVKLAADSCGSEAVRAQVYPASRALEEGMSISEAFGRTGAFSPIVMDMTRTGEMTGNLDQMLQKVADYYEDEAQLRATQISHIFAVVVFLCVAVYVAYVVISFYMGYVGGIMNAGGE